MSKDFFVFYRSASPVQVTNQYSLIRFYFEQNVFLSKQVIVTADKSHLST